jgi:hypothetical protein
MSIIRLKDILKEESVGNDGDSFFSDSAWSIANGLIGGKSRATIVYMSPKDFLKVAEHMPKSAIDAFHNRADEIKALMNKGVKMSSLPQLDFEHDGKGISKVVNHDGRHRALALSLLNVKSMPVVFTSRSSRNGQSIRWNEQGDPQSFDYFKQVWPTMLKSQTSGEIPFPVPDPRITEPYEQYVSKYKKIKDGISDGRVVINEIPNMSSIGSSLDDYMILDGIYDIPMNEFKLSGKHYSAYGQEKIDNLAYQIKQSNEINPLIVVLDKEGLYVLEGSHRIEALYKLKAKSFPAKLVLDKESLGI